jgi:hypothetical protein
MARGWESKSVEQQQADMGQSPESGKPRLSAEEKEMTRKREGLQLARKHLMEQLQASSRPKHRQMLERSILEIDKQLSSFDKFTPPPEPK